MAEAAQAPQQQFAIQRIYLKDVSFEAPSSPVMFQKSGTQMSNWISTRKAVNWAKAFTKWYCA